MMRENGCDYFIGGESAYQISVIARDDGCCNSSIYNKWQFCIAGLSMLGNRCIEQGGSGASGLAPPEVSGCHYLPKAHVLRLILKWVKDLKNNAENNWIYHLLYIPIL